ncbi:hypothetical protein I6N90_21490 [Paenibacillus sp. GSMTC-2017]|uniref:hypothetical protein n=1 Tax=Paenibacillus sp. GSMTC-2017 TaxID=2794350 RepID=UPI0018D902AA|nr:hypothetical protein [Paenibacillus sp. GSMTC-2017]MBH5320370.1 hypothetical protein [Paenibacillus sp. GSMTC-2017]
MSKLSFRDLFKSDTLERDHSFVPYIPSEDEITSEAHGLGMPFPDLTLDERLVSAPSAAILFISLTCSSCIDLLPKLLTFSNTYTGILLLISSASLEDNNELAHYYDYPFPVITMAENSYKSQFKLDATPSAIILEHGLMKQRFTIEDINHLYRELGLDRGGE